MNTKYLEADDEEAVSPVIGVILMVAITVILAAVIGGFVLNLTQGKEPVPQARFNFQQDGEVDAPGSTVKISHKGGETIDNSDGDSLEVLLGGVSSGVSQFSSTEISAGSSVTVDISGTDDGGPVDVKKGDLVEVKWTSDSGKQTQILQDYELQ